MAEQYRTRSRTAYGLLYIKVLLCLLLAPAAMAADEVRIRADSPDTYSVIKGDTLWDIAGRFLEDPWLWPQVWQINPQISDPDLIYPGDVVELVYQDGAPVLRLSRTEVPDLPVVRRSPQIRRETIRSPIPAISLDQIDAFLSNNSVITASELERAPYLLAEEDGRRLISQGSKVYARGKWSDEVSTYDLVRQGRSFKDPDTGTVIGTEAVTVGAATLLSINGDRATLMVTDSLQEIKPGDQLIPRKGLNIESRYMPEPPPFSVDAAIVSIGFGKNIGGQFDTLILNKGENTGLEAGQILTIQKPGKVINDKFGTLSVWQQVKKAFRSDKAGDQLAFAGEKAGTVLIYRVFESTSMALVLKSTDVIRLNDRLVTP